MLQHLERHTLPLGRHDAMLTVVNIRTGAATMKRKPNDLPPTTHQIDHQQLAREIVKAQREAEAAALAEAQREAEAQEAEAQREAKARDRKKASEQPLGCIVTLIIAIVIGAVMYNAERDPPSPAKNATAATAKAFTRATRASATATADACIDRQHRTWCTARRTWAADEERKLSLLLKSVGGLDGLTKREQQRVANLEHELSQYRLFCEGSEADNIVSAFEDSFNISAQIRKYKSRC